MTAYERGWSKLKNGELLDEAEKEGFEVLVTTVLNLKALNLLFGDPANNLTIDPALLAVLPFDNIDSKSDPVPESATLLLLLVGSMAFVWIAKFRGLHGRRARP